VQDAYRADVSRLQTSLMVERERVAAAQSALVAESATYKAMLRGRGAEQERKPGHRLTV